jgi:hypothetical protein
MNQTATALPPNSTLSITPRSWCCVFYRFGNWRITHPHHYRVLQRSVTSLKSLCALAIHTSPHSWQPMAFYCLHTFLPFIGCQTLSSIFNLSFSLSHMHLRIPMSFRGLVIFQCLDGLQFIYAFSHWREDWSFSSFAITKLFEEILGRWFLEGVLLLWQSFLLEIMP